jgi:LCP family protein required for cell wall assembly
MTRRLWRGGVRLGVVLALAGLLVPPSVVHPTTIALTRVQSAKDVDFADGVVWILALGSDARDGEDLLEGRTDAIQLIGLDLESGRAAGLGVPRDTLLDIPGVGSSRINVAMRESNGTDLTAELVADLTGITPDYVLLSGFDGFRDMVDTIGGVEVRSDVAFDDEEFDLHVRKGVNDFNGTEALDYARTRDLPNSDYGRMANQQQMLLGILRNLRANEDEEGFMERGTLSALSGLRTELAPTELYRLAQAITLVRPDRVELCVLTGTDESTELGEQVIILDTAEVRRIGADVEDDLRYDEGC